jgi:hypothetical protein
MILSSTVYNVLLTTVRKDRRGKSLSIDEFNEVSVGVNKSLYDDYYKKFEGNIESSDTMGYFKKFNEPINLVSNATNTASVGTLPDDYYHVIGRPKTISGSTVKWVDVVTAQENAKRSTDYLTQATTTYPTCQIGGINGSDELLINVYPYTITTIYLDYLRLPVTPYLDYYVDNVTLNVEYMAEGATVNVPALHTYRDGTAGGGVGIVSQTHDWEWSDEDLGLIIAKFCLIIGIQLPDEILIQAGTMNEQKILA